MFYKLVYQNAKRSRRENLIYFFTLVTAVAAFYLILALEHQDVITYLKTFESNALDNLFTLMPVLYAVALFLVAFLALFANRYQLDRRGREFGLYLVCGMRRRRLFLQLLCEGALTCCFALVAGIIAGGLLSELISLVTSRLVGQGIIGHQLSFSLAAAGWTALGFLLIQIVISLLMVARLSRRELHELLYGSMEKKQKRGSTKGNVVTLLVGMVLLVLSYFIIIRFFVITSSPQQLLLSTLAAVILCGMGTLLFTRGTARLISLMVGSSKQRLSRGLSVFTLRQFQEFIANKPLSVTASSFLVFFALLFLSAGAGVILSNGSSQGTNVYDFTVVGEEEEVKRVLGSAELKPYVFDLNPLELGRLPMSEADGSELPATGFDWANLRLKLLAALPAGVSDPALTRGEGYTLSPNDPEALFFLNLLDSRMPYPELIPESSYARLLAAAGLEPLSLGSDEVAFYLNPQLMPLDEMGDLSVLQELVQQTADPDEPLLRIADQPLRLAPLPPMRDLVTDRNITIFFAVIVPDALFEQVSDPSYASVYWNFRIPPNLAEQQGLMVPIKEASELLALSGLEYESNLQNFARRLFFTVAGSYTFLYLGFLFLLIGCTVLALQFLTQTQRTNRRYLTLGMLGAEHKQMRRSLYAQIAAYFTLPLALACMNAVVGLRVLLSLLHPYLGRSELLYPFTIAMAGAVILMVTFYALIVARSATGGLEKLLGSTEKSR